MPLSHLRFSPVPWRFGRTAWVRVKENAAYRQWCLQHRLFLNPLNDLGNLPIAARDTLGMPAIVVHLDEGPSALGFFNQIKQEYVTARYLFYEAARPTSAHFSDKEVSLTDTLDYPAYGLGVERVRVAFRLAYSLFDKIAFYLNYYFAFANS